MESNSSGMTSAEMIESAKKLVEYASDLMLKEKKNAAEIIEILTEQGLDKEGASAVVGMLETRIMDNEKKREVRRTLISGAIWCIAGISIVVTKDIRIVAWGVILIGAVRCIGGMVRLLKS